MKEVSLSDALIAKSTAFKAKISNKLFAVLGIPPLLRS